MGKKSMIDTRVHRLAINFSQNAKPKTNNVKDTKKEEPATNNKEQEQANKKEITMNTSSFVDALEKLSKQ